MPKAELPKTEERKEAETETPSTADSKQEKIRKLAYQLYVARGAQPGKELEDWLQAEQLIEAGKAEPSE